MNYARNNTCHFSRMHWVCVCVRWMATCRTHTHAHTHTRTHTHTYIHTHIHTHTTHKHTHTQVIKGRFETMTTGNLVLHCVAVCCSVLQCVAVCCSISKGVTKPWLLVTILESQPIPKFTIRDSFGLTFQKNYHLSLLQRSQENQRLFNWTMCIWVCICIFIGIYVCIYIHIWIIYLCTHMHM